MKQYRPNVDLQRKLYSIMVCQRVVRRRQGKPLEPSFTPQEKAAIFSHALKSEAGSLALISTGKPCDIHRQLEGFVAPRLAKEAACHADSGLRELGLGYLRELAAEGDPFAADLLREFPPPK